MFQGKQCLTIEKSGGTMFGEMANKVLVLTLPALRNFDIRARHKGWVVVSAVFSRSGRGRAAQHRR